MEFSARFSANLGDFNIDSVYACITELTIGAINKNYGESYKDISGFTRYWDNKYGCYNRAIADTILYTMQYMEKKRRDFIITGLRHEYESKGKLEIGDVRKYFPADLVSKSKEDIDSYFGLYGKLKSTVVNCLKRMKESYDKAEKLDNNLKIIENKMEILKKGEETLNKDIEKCCSDINSCEKELEETNSMNSKIIDKYNKVAESFEKCKGNFGISFANTGVDVENQKKEFNDYSEKTKNKISELESKYKILYKRSEMLAEYLQVEKLKGELEKQKKKYKELKEETVKELRDTIRELRKENESLKESISHKNESDMELKHVKEELEQLKNKYDFLEKGKKGLSERCIRAYERSISLSKENFRLEADKKAQLINFQKSIAELSNRVNDETKKKDEFKCELESLRTQLEKVQNENTSLKDDIKKLECEKNRQENDIASLQKQLAELNKSNKGKQENETMSSDKVKDLEKRVEELRTQLIVSNADADDLFVRNNFLANKLTKKSRNLSITEKRVRSLRRRNYSLNNKLDETHRDVSDKTKQLALLRGTNFFLNNTLAATYNELNFKRLQSGILEREVISLKDENSKLQRSSSELNKEKTKGVEKKFSRNFVPKSIFLNNTNNYDLEKIEEVPEGYSSKLNRCTSLSNMNMNMITPIKLNKNNISNINNLGEDEKLALGLNQK